MLDQDPDGGRARGWFVENQCTAISALDSSSKSRLRSSAVSLSVSSTTTTRLSVPVNAKGILDAYSSTTGVPVSSPTSNVSSRENRTPTLRAIEPWATCLPSTNNVPVPPLPMPPPSYANE